MITASMGWSQHLHGVNVFESVHAVELVKRPKPRTLDMQNLVDSVGVKKEWRPTIFQTPEGLIVHPEIQKQIRNHFQYQTDRMTKNIFGLYI